jgi:hypothetical protein
VKYDPSLPTAVFLGPSLPHAKAKTILAANYYPPVKLGDVYRLLTSGVKHICIIDGVFHGTTPVWQREILSALRAGIRVLGAASMGALRAVELAPYGMVGCGRVYRWYVEGTIEGDDEVALLHMNSDLGYGAITQPLVDLRHILGQAVEQGILTQRQSAELLSYQKALAFTRRGRDSLLASPPCAALPDSARVALANFLNGDRESIKALDAIEALTLLANGGLSSDAPKLPPRPPVERPEETLMRGVPTQSGKLLPLGTVLERVTADSSVAETILRPALLRFFLLEWLAEREVEVPVWQLEDFRRAWFDRHVHHGLDAWLTRHGLTAAELELELAHHAADFWLRERGPASFGLNSLGKDDPLAFVADWARRRGVSPDRVDVSEFGDAGLARWVLEQGPWHFGFENWSPGTALLRELQLASTLHTYVSRSRAQA